MGVNLDFYSVAIPGTGQGSNPEVNFPAGPNGGLYANGVYAGASEGVITSPSNSFEPIFNVSANNIATTLTAAGPNTTVTVEGIPLYNAQGGNQRLLRNGLNVTPIDDPYTTAINPHTALGVSRDGRRIFLMVVDGRQGNYAYGMRTDEMADLLRHYGAWDAINVDGGGSSTMVMDDRNDTLANARVINSPSDGSTPQTPGNERLVANNMAVFALHNPAYTPLPPVPRPPAASQNRVFPAQAVLSNFDDPAFNDGFGHFPNAAPNTSANPYRFASLASGSNRGVSPASRIDLDIDYRHTGSTSARLTIVSSDTGTNGFKLRLLSGGGDPVRNVFDDPTLRPIIDPVQVTNEDLAMGRTGYVGFFLRLEPGSQDLWISILVDDGVISGNSSTRGTERGTFYPVIADGTWHLYQWNLADPDEWFNFASGDGDIDGPNGFIDALYFSSAPSTSSGPFWNGTFWIDTIVYNPDGPIVLGAIPGTANVPEAATAFAWLAGGGLMLRRFRRVAPAPASGRRSTSGTLWSTGQPHARSDAGSDKLFYVSWASRRFTISSKASSIAFANPRWS